MASSETRSRYPNQQVESLKDASAWRDPGPNEFHLSKSRKLSPINSDYYEGLYLEDLVVSDYYAKAVDLLDERLPPLPIGRPRQMTMSAMAFFLLGVAARMDLRELRGNMSDTTWNELRAITISRWGEQSPRVLPERPPTRQSIQGWKARIIHTDFFESFMEDFRKIALQNAIDAGLFMPGTGSWTNLSPNQAVQGDGTWYKSPYGHENGAHTLDDKTGELTTRRYDPTAVPTPSGKQTGHNIVITSGRLPEAQERWVLDFTGLVAGETEMDAFVVHVQALASELRSDLKCAIFDMAFTPEAQRQVYEAGVIPIAKVPRSAGMKVTVGKLAKQVNFKTMTGESRPLDVFTRDGAPCIVVIVSGEEHLVELETVKRNWHGPSIGFFYRIPSIAAVSQDLRGAEGRFGLNPSKASPADFRNFRAVPEGTNEFDDVFPNRQDTESINSDLKRRHASHRARSWSLPGQLIDIAAFSIFTNIRANRANQRRTQDPPTRVAA